MAKRSRGRGVIEILAVLGLPLAGARCILAVVGDRGRGAARQRRGEPAHASSPSVALTVAGDRRRAAARARPAVLRRRRSTCSWSRSPRSSASRRRSSRGRTCASSSEHGRLTAGRLRLYHSMYQLFNFTMLLALLTNNMGILWVAMEAATLATVLLVSLYRTPASLEAAWKYFILCGVGLAQALFGTILLYFAAEKLLGAEGGRAAVDRAQRRQGQPRADRAVDRVRVPAGRLRHQGRPRAAAQLAARRPRRGPDAGVGGALRAAAQRRAVRGRPLQGAGRRLAAHDVRQAT